MPELEPHHIFALDSRTDMIGLRPHLLHQPGALDRVGESRIIFHVCSGHQLTALLEPSENQGLQQGARGVNRSRIGGGPRTNNDEAFMLNSGRGQLDPRMLSPPTQVARRPPYMGAEVQRQRRRSAKIPRGAVLGAI